MSARVPTASVNKPVQREFDKFSSISLKYGFLYGLDRKSRILLLGEYYQSMARDLAQSYETVQCITQAAELAEAEIGSYDLICLDAYSRWTDSDMPALIRTARSNLSTSGTLLVAATNRLSIERILNTLRRRLVRQMRGLTPWGYKKALKAAGFSSVHEFIVLPSLHKPEEYIDSINGEVELPGFVSFLHKIICAIGLYRYAHNDYLYVASTRPTSGFTQFAAAIEGYTTAPSEPRQDCMRVERFDLRDRGALMFMLSDRARKYRYVVRVAVSESVNSVIARNKLFTDRILTLDKLNQSLMRLVPRSIAAFEYRGCYVYVENRVLGVLVWKVVRNRHIEGIAYRGAFEFIHAFNLATMREYMVDSALFGELIGNDLIKMRSAFGDSGGADEIIDGIELYMRTYFTDRKLYVVWGHGDYGYGNILCDRSSGRVQGVIDWDTHVEQELPGVDLCNLLLQRISAEFSGDVALTMEKLHGMIVDTGKLDSDLPGYGKEDFNLDVAALTVYLCITGLRIVKRSIPYEKEFSLGLDRYLAILRSGLRILETIAGTNINAENDIGCRLT